MAGVGDAGQAQGSKAVSRVERVFSRPWSSTCDFDACAVPILFEIPVTTPVPSKTVDVTMTLTFEYGTTPGTAASVGAGFETPSSAIVRMDPRVGFRLAPSEASTTTTVTWVKRGLRGAGRTYTFHAGISVRSLVGDDTFSAHGRG